MAKNRYIVKENKTVGRHSFYAVPVSAGTLTTDELLEEALDGKSIEPSVARAAITEFMRCVQRNVKRGFRCQLGDQFLTIYPNLSCSVKDTVDKDGNVTHVATADDVNAQNGKSRLGCTVSAKFSQQFAQEVSWQKVTSAAAAAAAEENEDGDDATEGNENVEQGTDNTQGSGSGDGNGGSGGGPNLEP